MALLNLDLEIMKTALRAGLSAWWRLRPSWGMRCLPDDFGLRCERQREHHHMAEAMHPVTLVFTVVKIL